MKHRHYNKIILWAEDPANRKVQYKSRGGKWDDCTPSWGESNDFRFRPPTDSNGKELVAGKRYRSKDGMIFITVKKLDESTGYWEGYRPWELQGCVPVEEKTCTNCRYKEDGSLIGSGIVCLWHPTCPVPIAYDFSPWRTRYDHHKTDCPAWEENK